MARQLPSWLIFDVRQKISCVNKLRIAGWSFIPVAVAAAIIGFVYQERAGGMAKSPEAQSAAGVFLACLGAAGILLTADSHQRGVFADENREVSEKDRPREFRIQIGMGYLFWALFLVVGLLSASKVWIR